MVAPSSSFAQCFVAVVLFLYFFNNNTDVFTNSLCIYTHIFLYLFIFGSPSVTLLPMDLPAVAQQRQFFPRDPYRLSFIVWFKTQKLRERQNERRSCIIYSHNLATMMKQKGPFFHQKIVEVNNLFQTFKNRAII